MACEFPDRSAVLFGREPDVAYLLKRSEHAGLTAVMGRAQMGKSWLLTEIARRFSRDAGSDHSPAIHFQTLLGQPSYLVGSAESLGETADLLLRAVVDLYSRWLSDSSYWEQAQVIYQQQKKDFIGRAGEAVGKLFEKLSKLGPKPLEAVGGLVKETFEALASANRELVSGGIQLPRLQIEQGRDLLNLVHKITNCRIVLVFDQWEKSPGLELETNVLDSFLRHLGDWPPCHIFVGLRADEKPRKTVNQLIRGFPGAAEVYDLPPMHLDADASGSALLQYIRAQVSAARAVSDQALFEMISGYPGTVAQWTSSYNAGRLQSLEELQKVADDANAYRFAEFTDDLLHNLSDKQRLLSIRLVLLPATGNPENWNALKSIVLEGGQGTDLDGLKRGNVIESTSPPTYGHAKRREAALQWFISSCYEELREICERLILNLAGEVRDLSSRVVPYASSLVELSTVAASLGLSKVAQALCQSGLSVSQLEITAPEQFLGSAAELKKVGSQAAPVLAMGLFNTLIYAKQEEALEWRDGLLEELRHLAQSYPQDTAVRKQFAMGLGNTLAYATQERALERRDALLDDLRELAQSYPQDAVVRESLAIGLYNTLNAATQEGALERRDTLLEQLRQLAHRYPQDAAVRKQLAMVLYHTLNAAKQEGALERRDTLLEQLRQLAQSYPQDAVVRKQFAMGLGNTLAYATQERALERRDALLDDLRQLAQSYPQDAVVREILATGLGNMLLYAKEEGALERRDALLDELRQLAQTYTQDASIRERLARELYNTLIDAKEEGALERRDILLEELRQLFQAYAQHAAVRERLAMGLLKTLNYAKEEAALERRDTLLEQLRQLAQSYPHDAAVRENLAAGLVNTIFYTKQEGALERRDALLEELRELAQSYRQDAAVRELLASGLFNTLIEEALERRDALLEELRELAQSYPQDAAVRELLASGLFNTLNEEALERRAALLEELRQLAPSRTFRD